MIRVGFVYGSLDGSGSVRTYLNTLVEKLGERERIEPVVIYSGGNEAEGPTGVKLVQVATRLFLRWHQVARSEGLDLFHLNAIPTLGQIAASRSPCPVVAPVHGTAHWASLPEEIRSSRRYKWRMRASDRLGRYTVDRVFAVSQSVKQILHERAGYPSERISVTYEGVADQFYESPRKGRGDLPEQYVLHVSKAAPKKNVPTLLRAFDELPQENVELIVAGKGWESQCAELAGDLGIRDRVRFPGYVSQHRLLQLYDNATCFTFPSYHETFGLPLVEAMARGTPVVTTAQYAIPEIVGDAAHLVSDPRNYQSLATAIDHILSGGDYANELTERGLERADSFRWEKHIDRIITEYRRCLS